MLWRLIKLIFGLGLLAAIGLVAYAYLGPIFTPGDFAPPQEEVREPVTLTTE